MIHHAVCVSTLWLHHGFTYMSSVIQRDGCPVRSVTFCGTKYVFHNDVIHIWYHIMHGRFFTVLGTLLLSLRNFKRCSCDGRRDAKLIVPIQQNSCSLSLTNYINFLPYAFVYRIPVTLFGWYIWLSRIMAICIFICQYILDHDITCG